jgi:hypothetical protein
MGAVRARAMTERLPSEDKFLPYALESIAYSLTLYNGVAVRTPQYSHKRSQRQPQYCPSYFGIDGLFRRTLKPRGPA